jgi:transportin-3
MVAVFETLQSWLSSGELMASQVSQTPLFTAMFDSLPSDQLFDAAVDVICDLIRETQEVEDNVDVIQQIIPRVIALRPQLEEHKDDPDRIRGYCRIFCEAGEYYKDLIVRHPNDLFPLVEAIAACAAYPDLEIVPITFNFWYALATALGRQPEDSSIQPILDIFANLQAVIINHLHFPRDDEQQTAQERDEFRMFRHRMGDTLKDCCHVLGAPTCLRRSYELVTAALAKGSPSWQEIEAPLFSMRSMGAEVDPDDDEILPHIMDMLPKLPDHPRIRYAAILVISRYTQWIDRHPQDLAFQLQYISAGFEMAEEEVSAAAAQAMKFMCQDCNQHLVPFLPQLHTFISSVGDRLDQPDMVEVCEAIGYIISSMPAAQAAQALQQFCEPLIQRVQAVASTPGVVAKTDVQKAAGESDTSILLSSRRPRADRCVPFCRPHPRPIATILLRHMPRRIWHPRRPPRPIRQAVLHLRTRGLRPSPRSRLLPSIGSRAGHPTDAGAHGPVFRADRLCELFMDYGQGGGEVGRGDAGTGRGGVGCTAGQVVRGGYWFSGQALGDKGGVRDP